MKLHLYHIISYHSSITKTAEFYLNTQDFIVTFPRGNTTNGSNVITGVECREDFYLGDDGLCRPECTQFEYFPHRVENAHDIIFILTIAIASTAAVVVITVSCIRHQRL